MGLGSADASWPHTGAEEDLSKAGIVVEAEVKLLCSSKGRRLSPDEEPEMWLAARLERLLAQRLLAQRLLALHPDKSGAITKHFTC